MDRDPPPQDADFVTIEGDKAIWKNHWLAGGNEMKWDMTHYDVQLIGGIVLHQGKIAEMATGEGKTLVATLPVFLRSLSGRGVHVVTVNDYLSKRDSEWMGPLYMFHGRFGRLHRQTPAQHSTERRSAYECDITYGTNNEFGFDYLRDNMAMAPDDLVQRKHYYAIVDEVDSVLIDDARTPLIISGPVARRRPALRRLQGQCGESGRRPAATRYTDPRRSQDQDSPSADKERRKKALSTVPLFQGPAQEQRLIRFLSQEGMKNICSETEGTLPSGQPREMPMVTDPLYFVIDEKNRRSDLPTRASTNYRHTRDPQFFVLPDIAASSASSNISRPRRASGEKRRAHAELCRQGRARPHRHTAPQSLHPLEARPGICGRRQQE